MYAYVVSNGIHKSINIDIVCNSFACSFVYCNDGDFILAVNQGQTIEELQKDYGN
jgi:hydrogenase maturation factor